MIRQTHFDAPILGRIPLEDPGVEPRHSLGVVAPLGEAALNVGAGHDDVVVQHQDTPGEGGGGGGELVVEGSRGEGGHFDHIIIH